MMIDEVFQVEMMIDVVLEIEIADMMMTIDAVLVIEEVNMMMIDEVLVIEEVNMMMMMTDVVLAIEEVNMMMIVEVIEIVNMIMTGMVKMTKIKIPPSRLAKWLKEKCLLKPHINVVPKDQYPSWSVLQMENMSVWRTQVERMNPLMVGV